MITSSSTVDRVFSPFEVAALDVQAHARRSAGVGPVRRAVRDTVPFAAYLFYKWGRHPGAEPDEWGEAVDPAGLVAQAADDGRPLRVPRHQAQGRGLPARRGDRGHRGAAVRVPRTTPFGSTRTRLVGADVGVGRGQDRRAARIPRGPHARPAGHGRGRAARSPMPLATNMCVVAFDRIPPAFAQGAVGVVLSDHHYWGGLRASADLARICATWDVGLSMHSNSHLGISLAAMVQLARGDAQPHVRRRHPHALAERGRRGGVAVRFVDGSVVVPDGPDWASARPGRARAAARELPAVRGAGARRHRVPAQHRPGLRGDQPALVGPPPLH